MNVEQSAIEVFLVRYAICAEQNQWTDDGHLIQPLTHSLTGTASYVLMGIQCIRSNFLD